MDIARSRSGDASDSMPIWMTHWWNLEMGLYRPEKVLFDDFDERTG